MGKTARADLIEAGRTWLCIAARQVAMSCPRPREQRKMTSNGGACTAQRPVGRTTRARARKSARYNMHYVASNVAS